MTSTARTLLLATLAASLGTAALAAPTYNPTKMTCESVQNTIDQHGSVMLRYTSARVKNLPLYDIYVRNSNFCQQGEVAVSASVPTTDRKNCPVANCEFRSADDDNDLFFPSR